MVLHVASLPTPRHHYPFSNIHFFSGRVEGRFEGLRLPLLVDMQSPCVHHQPMQKM